MIISINNGQLTLDMGITPAELAKSTISQRITDEGFYIQPDEDGFTINPWRFSSIIENNEKIEVIGELPNASKTLYEIITKSGQSQEKKDSVNKIISFYEYVIANNLSIPVIGPLSTIFCNDGSFLLLPTEFFDRAISVLSDQEYSMYYGCWVNSALTGSNAIRFLLSVYIYYFVNDRFPYTNKISQERREDYYDKNYIPFLYTSTKILEKKAKIIDNYLSLEAGYTLEKKGKKKIEKQLSERIESIDYYFDEKIIESKEKALELMNKRQKTANRIHAKVNRRRFFRQKNTIISICAVIVVIITLSTISTIHDKNLLPSTLGMNSIQTVETFYTGVNNLDNSLLDAALQNSKAAKPYNDLINGYFVISKYRASVDPTTTTYPFTEWLYSRNYSTHTVFGVTNLKINQEIADFQSTLYKIENKDKQQITSEFNQAININDTKSYTATGYLIYTEGDNIFTIYKFTDYIQMKFNKDRWRITKIESQWEEVPFVYSEFIEKLQTAADSVSDIGDISSILKPIYDWIPTSQEIEKGGDILMNKIKESSLTIN